MTRAALLIAATFALAGCATQAAPTSSASYPEGYRGWTHVKSMWLGPGHGLADPFAGLHHVYVNAKGEANLRAGRPLPDGTVLVFDLLDGAVDNHAVTEGSRKFIGVMQKDRGAFTSTGGWGFEVFSGNSKTARGVTDGGASCFACHQSQKANDYVFTRWRD